MKDCFPFVFKLIKLNAREYKQYIPTWQGGIQMQTDKEAFMAILNGEHADHFVNWYNIEKSCMVPGDRYMSFPDYDAYGTGPDMWGVMWTNLGPNPGLHGSTVAKGFKLFDDMSEWRQHVKFPDYRKMPLKELLQNMKKMNGYDPEKHFLGCGCLSGAFERLHHMIGFENALTAFYEYPDEMHDYFNAFCEFRLDLIDMIWDAIQPECILMQDDWGQNNNMFFSPDIWREFIKPVEARYIEKIHGYGMKYRHHSCGYIKQIIPDLVEIGLDILEPVMYENDVPELLENYGDKLVFLGGINNRRMEMLQTPEERFEELKGYFDSYLPLGKWFPFYVAVNGEILDEFKQNVDKLVPLQTVLTADKPNPWEK